MMLFLTNRPTSALDLQLILGAFEPCTVLSVTDRVQAEGEHSIVLCDFDPIDRAGLSFVGSVIERHASIRDVPLLYLSRQRGDAALAQAKDLGATAVMPRNVSPHQILFTVRRLVEAWTPAVRRPYPPVKTVVAANIRKAQSVYMDMIMSLRRGGPISIADLERGTDALLAAVGGVRISVWLDVVRSYDDITHQHCLLVASFAVALATAMGVTLHHQRLIGKAALLHDIGKLTIPADILNKPGQLTPSEMEVVRTHPTVGHDMLARQGDFDRQTLDMVRHHHEFLDGSGYPDGLSGDRISTFVRIMTICDVYAALVERRSYKEPMSPAYAMTILREMGPKLDQKIVGLFSDMIEHASEGGAAGDRG